MSTFDEKKIKKILKPIIKEAYEAKPTETDFRKNTVDVFSASLESAIQGISLEEWTEQEKRRQIQKTLQNKVGKLHQDILGTLDGVTNLSTGQVIDLKGDGFIAEIKNKHNTTKGNHKVVIYDDLEEKLKEEDKDTIAYYVEILPKNGKKYDTPFIPSDNKTKKQKTHNERIRQIDGQSFYEKVTGNPDALRELYVLLPKLTNQIINEEYGKQQDSKKYTNIDEFNIIYGDK